MVLSIESSICVHDDQPGTYSYGNGDYLLIGKACDGRQLARMCYWIAEKYDTFLFRRMFCYHYNFQAYAYDRSIHADYWFDLDTRIFRNIEKKEGRVPILPIAVESNGEKWRVCREEDIYGVKCNPPDCAYKFDTMEDAEDFIKTLYRRYYDL